MSNYGKGQRITAYFGESDQWQHQSLALALLEMLRREGCSGATVTRGVAGFGAGSRIKTSTVLRLSFDLPMVLTVVETPERAARLLPKISSMVGGGLVTVEDVDIYQYGSRFKDTLPDIPVRDVMTRDVITVHPDTPVAEAVALLLQHAFTTLPVVDAQQHVCGLLHEDDLVPAGETGLALRLHEALAPGGSEALVRELVARGETVTAVMDRHVTPVDPETSIRRAAHLMLTHDLKQLPVVDDTGKLVGIVSRIDLLRAVSAGYMPQHEGPPAVVPTGGEPMRVHDVMHPDVSTVAPEAPIEEVGDALIRARDRCVLVVDAAGVLVGLITPSDLVYRLDPDMRPGLLHLLGRHLHLTAQGPERQSLRKARAKQARDLMTTPVVWVTSQTPIGAALLQATEHGLKRLPVCDAQQHPLGLVSRKDLLRAFVR